MAVIGPAIGEPDPVKTGYLGVGVIMLGLFMLAMTTLPWSAISIIEPSPDGFDLPNQIRAVTGVEMRPATVTSSLLTMAAGALLIFVTPVGRAFGSRGRIVTIALASMVVLGAAVIVFLPSETESVQVVILGGSEPMAETRPAVGGFYLGLLGAVVLSGLAWRLREQPAPTAPASTYTVEAVRAETSEDDEWDLADASVPSDSVPTDADPEDLP